MAAWPLTAPAYCKTVYELSVAILCCMQCGSVVLEKQSYFESSDPPLVLLHCQLPAMEVLMACVEMGWMAVLVSFDNYYAMLFISS